MLAFRARLQSFRYAIRGLMILIREEPNARIHLTATALVGLTAYSWGVSRAEGAALALAIGLVFAAEALNTAIETLCDLVSAERNEGIGRVKDLAAAAVLMASLAALAVAVFVFGAKFI